MKENIYQYINAKDGGVTAKEIIEKFFHVYDQYPPQMVTIVESMLKDDPRFVCDDMGEWHVKKNEGSQNLSEAIFSIVEIEAIPVNLKNEIPLLLGVVQLRNGRVLSQLIYSFELLSSQYSSQTKEQISAFLTDQKSGQLFNQHAEEIYQNLEKTIVISYSPSKVIAFLNSFFEKQMGLELEVDTISLANLARKLIPGIKIKSVTDIAEALSIIYHTPLNLTGRLELTIDIVFALLEELKQLDIQNVIDLKELIEDTKHWVDFGSYNFDRDYIKNFPVSPGVYFMKDNEGKIFYVGKAKNLKSRIESYFVNRFEMDEKGKSILSRLNDLAYEEVGSELDALLLENKYISEYKPDLNTQIKIHPTDISKYEHKRIILFLTGLLNEQVVLYLINGTLAADRIIIHNKKDPTWREIKKITMQVFFDQNNLVRNYSIEQIEIIWRWFSVHKEDINLLDVERCGSLNNCIEAIKKYLADEKLFSEKIHYI